MRDIELSGQKVYTKSPIKEGKGGFCDSVVTDMPPAPLAVGHKSVNFR